MLIAYIDEVGEAGAYVSKTHKRYNTSPAFGYAGFILPADSVRDFSRHVADVKKEIHAYLQGDASHADYNPQWDAKVPKRSARGRGGGTANGKCARSAHCFQRSTACKDGCSTSSVRSPLARPDRCGRN